MTYLPLSSQSSSWDAFKGACSLATFEAFVSALPIDPCTTGLFCVLPVLFFFQKKKSACGIEMVLAFPCELAAELHLQCVTGAVPGYFHWDMRCNVWTPAEHPMALVQEKHNIELHNIGCRAAYF